MYKQDIEILDRIEVSYDILDSERSCGKPISSVRNNLRFLFREIEQRNRNCWNDRLRSTEFHVAYYLKTKILLPGLDGIFIIKFSKYIYISIFVLQQLLSSFNYFISKRNLKTVIRITFYYLIHELRKFRRSCSSLPTSVKDGRYFVIVNNSDENHC